MQTKFIVWIIVIIALLGSVYLLNNENKMNGEAHEDGKVEAYEIYPSVVSEKIKNKEDIVLLDVRTLEEYEEVHLENALLLPVQELSQQSLSGIGLGEESKDKEIYIYCRSGARAKTAYDIMNSLGYTNIKSIAGGIVQWQEDNYPFTEIGEYKEPDNSTPPTGDSPKIVFDKNVHDFGEIPQSGGVVETTFTIKNEGNKTLEIGELSTSCGCTTVKISEKNIAPNDSAILTVYFDPDFHKEPTEKLTRTVFIPTNDPSTSEAEVKITVDILENK